MGLHACGCRDNATERVSVAGKVLIDGQPLTSGTIRFVPESGRPASSAIMTDGSFELASESVNRLTQVGVPPGSYRVQISSSQIVDDRTIHWNIPEKYADFRTSGLKVTIERPTSDLMIDLSWRDVKRSGEAKSSTDERDVVEEKKVVTSSSAAVASAPQRESDSP